MKLNFSDELLGEVVEECLLSAGALGHELLSCIDWKNCNFNLLEIPEIRTYPDRRYEAHVLRHTMGAGTFEAPDNSLELAQKIRQQGASLITREFALDKPHKLMPSDRSFVTSDGVYYFYDGASDDEDQLLRVIRLARSWTFLGLTCTSSDVGCLPSQGVAEWLVRIKSLILPIYAGDTFIEIETNGHGGS